MKQIVLALAAALGLAACDTATVPATTPGSFTQASRDVPVMGSVTGFVGGDQRAWETLDFSVGALDGSAFVTRRDGGEVLTITGFVAGSGGAPEGRIRIVAGLGGLAPGPGSNVSIILFESAEESGPRLQSTGVPLLNVSNLVRLDEIGGTAQGTFVATLCRVTDPDAPADTSDCRDVAGEFDTRVQFDGV